MGEGEEDKPRREEKRRRISISSAQHAPLNINKTNSRRPSGGRWDDDEDAVEAGGAGLVAVGGSGGWGWPPGYWLRGGRRMGGAGAGCG